MTIMKHLQGCLFLAPLVAISIAPAYKPDDLHGSAIWHLFALLPDGARGWTPNS